MSADSPSTFEEFWPYYLGEHRSPLCRGLHYFGTSMALLAIGTSVVTLNPALALAALVVGYGPAWVAHFLVERNRPATFKYPLWSLRADFKMLGLALLGKMPDEMRRFYGSVNPPKGAPRVDIRVERIEATA